MRIAFKPNFLRKFRKLPSRLQDEIREKIELFADPENHQRLRVHKLKGPFAGCSSFTVNYRYRIVFVWEDRDSTATLLDVGDHSVYD